MLTQEHKQIAKLLQGASRSRHLHDVFSDWLECAFCALAKTTTSDFDRRQRLEKRYMDTVKRYDNEKDVIREIFPQVLGLTLSALREEKQDFLGVLAGELNQLSAGLGQFFTPFAVSQLMAQMIIAEQIEKTLKTTGYVDLNEPAAGSGGLVIASAAVIEDAGYDPSQVLVVETCDLSATAYKMCYIQLYACDIAAKVWHGNTLSQEMYDVSLTPAYIEYLYRCQQL